ncbi:MAG: transcription antitermination factor NusB [Actinomycetota bacterium]
MRTISSSRLLAFEALAEVELNGKYSNLILPKMLTRSGLSVEDRALVSELVYGTLRMQGRHDALISRASTRPLNEIDEKVRIVLRLGVHQLTQMRIPSHAAIYETIELAKRTVGQSSASFCNAILRKIDDDSNQVLEASDRLSAIALNHSHPEWIISSYMDSLKSVNEVESLARSNNVPASPTLIAWPGRATLDELCESGAEPLEGSSVAATAHGDPAQIPAIRERRAGVQDRGSQLVVEKFLETYQEGLRWLDMCAGPGGKAAYLSSVLKLRGGEFVANEISRERSELVKQVVAGDRVENFDARNLPENFGSFDRILLDAPCTGIGALRRRPEVRWRRSVQDLRSLTELQSQLLDCAAKITALGGIIAYVTCSSHQAETTFQMRAFLKRHSNFVRVPISDPRVNTEGELQLWTHRDGCDSMFLSMVQRVGSDQS